MKSVSRRVSETHARTHRSILVTENAFRKIQFHTTLYMESRPVHELSPFNRTCRTAYRYIPVDNRQTGRQADTHPTKVQDHPVQSSYILIRPRFLLSSSTPREDNTSPIGVGTMQFKTIPPATRDSKTRRLQKANFCGA